MKTEEEIKNELNKNKALYDKEFPDTTIPTERYGQACALKGYIDSLEWVLEG